MEGFLTWLDSRMTQPTDYGWFHLISIAIIIALTIIICIKFKNSTDKQHRWILRIISIISIIFEIYKQIIFSYNSITGEWHYQWYAFPFQFCSTPMYVAFIASFIKNEKVQSFFNSYLGTFAFFAGLAVLAYPSSVWSAIIGINIQTMVCHGSMIILGAYMLVSGRCKLEHKTILKALTVFVIILAIGLALNLFWPVLKIDETFNMFFISPYYPCTLVLLQLFYPPTTPYFIFLLIYIIGFTIAAYLILLSGMGIGKLHKIRINKKEAKTKLN